MMEKEKEAEEAVIKSNAIEPIAESEVQAAQDGSNSEEATKEELKAAAAKLGDTMLALVVIALQAYISYAVGAYFGGITYGILTWVGLAMLKVSQYKDKLKLDFAKDIRAQVAQAEEQVKEMMPQVNQRMSVIFAAIAIALRVFCGI